MENSKFQINRLSWIIIPMLAFNLVPYIINTIILKSTKVPLSFSTYMFTLLAGIVLAIITGYFAGIVFGYKDLKDYLVTVLGCVSAIAFFNLFFDYISEVIIYKLPGKIAIYYIFAAIVVLLSAFIISFSLLKNLKKVKALLILTGLAVAFLVASDAFYLLSDWLMNFIRPSFGAMTGLMILYAIFESFCVFFLLYFAEKHRGDTPVLPKKTGLYMGIPFAVSVLCFVLTIVFESGVTPESVVSSDINEDVSLGGLELVMGNVELSQGFYKQALSKIEGWKAFAEEKTSYSYADSNDLNIRMLGWELKRDFKGIGNYLMFEDFDLETAKHYLLIRKELEQYNEDGKNDAYLKEYEGLTEDILNLLVGSNDFLLQSVTVNDFKGREEELKTVLAAYDGLDFYVNMVKIIADTGRDGKINSSSVNKLLDLAENNTKDLGTQYFAFLYASSYKTDGASHYKRTINAGKRFLAILKDEGMSEKDMIDVETAVASTMMGISGYEEAADILRKIIKVNKTKDNLLMLAQCYSNLSDSENCLETVNEIVKLEPDNLSALYYLALTNLKTGKDKESLENTSKLVNLFAKLEGEEKIKCDSLVYSMLQYYTVSDVREYRYNFGYPLKEELQSILDSNEMFKDYYEAVFYCFGSTKYEKALESVDLVLNKGGSLPNALYLKGSILFGSKRFEEALECYKQSVAISPNEPTVWYALANTYDELGRYEEGIVAANRVLNLMPDTDHDYDPYGVAIHANNLLGRLKNKLGGK